MFYSVKLGGCAQNPNIRKLDKSRPAGPWPDVQKVQWSKETVCLAQGPNNEQLDGNDCESVAHMEQ